MNDEILIQEMTSNEPSSSSVEQSTQLEGSMKVDDAKSIEFVILKNLKQSMIELKSHYLSNKPNIDPRELKHNDVLIVYQSIRRIIFKAIQALDEKINDLNMNSAK